MLIKIKDSNSQTYTKYYDVNLGDLKPCIGLVSTNVNRVSFIIREPIAEGLKGFVEVNDDYFTVNILEDFYFISDGTIVVFSSGMPHFIQHNVEEFRVGEENEFQPIENARYYQTCIVNIENNVFIPLNSAMHSMTNEGEVDELGLELIDYKL